MYSNFITPPDFVEEDKHTITIVDATDDDVTLLVRMAENTDSEYNIYLYKSEMNDSDWLAKATSLSKNLIVNVASSNRSDLCVNASTYYYGSTKLLSPSIQIDNILDYFKMQQLLNK